MGSGNVGDGVELGLVGDSGIGFKSPSVVGLFVFSDAGTACVAGLLDCSNVDGGETLDWTTGGCVTTVDALHDEQPDAGA